MNLVDLIKDQLAGGVLDKLSASIGESEEKTKAAAGVAVASLLSALAGLVTSNQGAESLMNSLRQFDGDSLSRLRTDLTQDDAGKIRDQGGDILGSLLGGDLTTLINVLTKFSGIGAAALKSLLSYLAPLILSVIAEQLKGKSLTPASLTGFFDEQKANIQAALPSGFSLAAAPTPHAKASVPAGPRADASGMPGWLLPLAALVLLGIAAWYFLGNQSVEQPGGMEPPVVTNSAPVPAEAPAPTPVAAKAPATAKAKTPVDPNAPVPTGAEVNQSLDGIFKTATEALTSVKDAETAEAALPTLDGLKDKIDSVKAQWDLVSPFGKAAVTKATSAKLSIFKTLVGKTLEIPGVSDKLKEVLDALVAKLSTFVANVNSTT